MEKIYFNSQDARNLVNIYGFAIFPIHGVKQDNTCTCNNPKCNNVGKHPATPDGFKSATKDIEQVKKLWAGRTGLNVGIATGEKSEVFVIDIDHVEAEAELAKIITLPNTYTVTTGRGKHLYFKYDKNRPIKNGTGIIPNVDIRGEGGYVAGAGSNHASGVTYNVVNPLEEFAEAPEELYELLKGEKTKQLLPSPTLLLRPNNEGWTHEQVKEHLSHISPDCDYDTWVNIGMGLHAEGLPFHLFDDWSRGGVKYDNSTADHWKSFTAGGGVTYGTVVALAKRGGWQYNGKQKATPLVSNTITEVIDEETGEIIPAVFKKPMFYIKGSDMQYKADSNDFVQGLLENGAMSVVYGESNCGKTFFMTDLSYHVAEGKQWRDSRVEGGIVVYVALEGIRGLTGRVQAYRQETGESLDNFLVVPCPFDFLDAEGDVTEFLALLDKIKGVEGDVKLIVIDTLARAMGGADENSGQDMGLLVKHADAIRDISGAHICFVHHSGKDTAKGARGHSSLRAAIDTELEVSRQDGDDYSEVKVVKQREMEMGEDMFFQLKSISIGVNKYNEEKTSCVVIPCEGVKEEKAIKLTPIQQFMYEAIIEAIDTYGRDRMPVRNMSMVKCADYKDLHEVLEAKGYKDFLATEKRTTDVQVKNATTAARVSLRKAGKINFANDYVWLVENE